MRTHTYALTYSEYRLCSVFVLLLFFLCSLLLSLLAFLCRFLDVVGFGLAINCNETMDETNWNSLFVICRLFQALLKIVPKQNKTIPKKKKKN